MGGRAVHGQAPVGTGHAALLQLAGQEAVRQVVFENGVVGDGAGHVHRRAVPPGADRGVAHHRLGAVAQHVDARVHAHGGGARSRQAAQIVGDAAVALGHQAHGAVQVRRGSHKARRRGARQDVHGHGSLDGSLGGHSSARAYVEDLHGRLGLE